MPRPPPTRRDHARPPRQAERSCLLDEPMAGVHPNLAHKIGDQLRDSWQAACRRCDGRSTSWRSWTRSAIPSSSLPPRSFQGFGRRDDGRTADEGKCDESPTLSVRALNVRTWSSAFRTPVSDFNLTVTEPSSTRSMSRNGAPGKVVAGGRPQPGRDDRPVLKSHRRGPDTSRARSRSLTDITNLAPERIAMLGVGPMFQIDDVFRRCR